MIIAKLFFWISVLSVFFIFCGYPLILWFICRIKANKFKANNFKVATLSKFPSVTLLISASNEEDVINTKIKNALALNYLKDKLEILVVSDASTDRTDEIVKKFSTSGIKLLRQDNRAGKTAALNMALPQTKGDIVIFSDANSMYDERSVKKMVKHFEDPVVGCVSGKTKYISRNGNTVAESTGLYTKMEIITKCLESKVFSCVGADGAIFAIRKSLYKPLKAYDINDFVIPLNIIEQGYRVILEQEAFCIEDTAKDNAGEFNRQVRITCRTIRAIFNNKTLLNPFRYPLFSFELFSHKIMKFLLPIFLLTIFIANFLLVFSGEIYVFTGALQVIFYLLLGYGYLERKKDQGLRLPGLAYTFGTVSFAFLIGWFKYFTGETYTTWNSERPEK